MTPFDAESGLRLPPSLPWQPWPAVLDAGERIVSAGRDAGAVLDALAGECLDVPADLVVVLLNDPATGCLEPVAVRHAAPDAEADLRHRVGFGAVPLAQLLARTVTARPGGPVTLPVDADSLPALVRDVVADIDPYGVVVVPLGGQLGLLGVVVLARCLTSFDDADRGRALGVARRGGLALEIATLDAHARRQAALVDLLGDAVIAVDPHEVVTGWNDAAERIYGIPATDAIGIRLGELMRTTVTDADSDGRPDPDGVGTRRLVEASGGNWQGRLRQDLPSGRSVEIDSRLGAVRDGDGGLLGYVAVNRDVGGVVAARTADAGLRRRLQDELSYRATHDELTDLPNRAALMAALSGSVQRLDGTRKLAVLFCDLDGFKDINDGLGHAVGDQVLVAVARRLRQRCRSADVVARFGGDEFVVVLSVSQVAQAVAMADRIVEVLAEPIVVGAAEVAPGVSIGITVVDVAPTGDDPVGTLLRDADTAMYHAKGRGRGRYEFFDASLRENIAERLELAAALHRAVTDDELSIVYQTRRYCGDRRPAGVEALLQWRHPVLGRVDPEVFIPIAERTGRIVEVGSWVLRRALREFAAVGDPRMSLAVNVSPRQLTTGRLAATVATALEETALEPWRLTLEITESALVDDPAAARAVLTDLRSLGVTIALDDFGTGWSSLSYLRTLPVDVLKIDRTFVADLPHDLDACAVVSAVLGLGHGMGLVVVAEGVESLEHLATLRDMGCDEYQGFLDGRPGPLAEVLDLTAYPSR